MTLIQDPPTRTGSAPAPGAGPDVPPDAADAPTPQPTQAAMPGAASRPSVLKFVDSVGRALDHLVETPTWSMTDAELGEALVRLTGEQARLHELRLRVLHEADARRVGHAEGATSTAAWLAHRTKLSRASIFADLHLARALDQEFTLTRAAMTRRHPDPTGACAPTATSADASAGADANASAGADANASAGADADAFAGVDAAERPATAADPSSAGDIGAAGGASKPADHPSNASDTGAAVSTDAVGGTGAAGGASKPADHPSNAGDTGAVGGTGNAGAADAGAGADADGGAGAEADTAPLGVVDAEKARMVIRAVEGLTQDYGDLVTPVVRRRAEAHLVDLAGRFDAATLKELAKRLVEVVCPEAADAAEAKKLDAEEQAARRKAYVQIRHHGDGTSSGSFRLPTLHAQLWAKALDDLTSPRKLGDARTDPATGRPYSTSTLRGQGFMTLLEQHLNLDTLPGSAGSAFTLVVHVDLDALRTGLGVAAVETGHRISAAEARRLSCNAAIIPMVLGGDSIALDVGRERRFFTKHQRIALDHAYRGCAADGCDRPPSQVEYHHLHAWHKGGKTDLKDGLPLCSPHHHMADHPELWDMTHLPNGAVRFTRRQ